MKLSDVVTVTINRLQLQACIGVLEAEKRIPQGFEVTLTVTLPYDGSDDIRATMNYAEACEVITAEAAKGGDLIEHVAQRMLRAIAARWPQIVRAELTLTKLIPPMPYAVGSVSATVTF